MIDFVRAKERMVRRVIFTFFRVLVSSLVCFNKEKDRSDRMPCRTLLLHLTR